MNTASVTFEPSLSDVARDLWAARLSLLGGLIAGILCAALYMAAAVPQYRASMLVAPTTRAGTPDIAALFPNNASFAMEYVMQSFGPGDSSDFMRFETILRESSVAAVLLEDEAVRRGLAAVRSFSFLPFEAPQTPAQMAAWLQKNIAVEPVGQTRLKRVAVLHPDPAFGIYLLGRAYAVTDGLIREELIAKTAKRLSYLTRALDETSHPEHRRALSRLLMDQEQIKMILAVNEPFAAQLSEPPAAGPKPAWPRKSVVFPAFIFAGMLLAYVLHAARRR